MISRGRVGYSIDQYIHFLLDYIPQEVQKRGSFETSAVDSNSYGWERNFYVAMKVVTDTLSERGYTVENKTKWDVLDYTIYKRVLNIFHPH